MKIKTNHHLHPIAIGALLATLVACNSQNDDSAASQSNPAMEKVSDSQSADAPDTPPTTISLDNADSELGKRFFVQCQACHTLDEGGINLTGPNLWGVLGRNAGKHDGFQYSDGLAQADFSWTVETLDQFLTKPNDFIGGTTMIFAGIADQKIRRDLIAYLIEATSDQ